MTTEENKPQVIEFDNVEDAIAHVQKLEKEASEAVARYRVALSELTGIQPGQQVGPMDILKMVLKFKDAK